MGDYVETLDMSQFVKKCAEHMSRRIDAEVLKRVEADLARYGYVKVVRCRDCKHHYTAPARNELEPYELHCCDLLDYEFEPEGFCSWAKRKEGGE